MKSSIIIPNYNGVDLLPKVLDACIAAKENEDNKISEIIVVDDASVDGSVDFIKKNYPGIKLIKHKLNRGFSSSVNTGVRMAKGELVVLINTDVIPSSDFLINSTPHFSDQKIFAVSFNEGKYAWAKGKFEGGFILHEPGDQTEKTHHTFWVSGGSGVFRRSLWIKFGGMDEKLFSPFYWEDVDISYRALKRGYNLLWEPKSKVLHDHEGTIGKISKRKRIKIEERNHLLFIWKDLTSSSLIRRHIIGLAKRCIRNPGYLFSVFKAFAKLRYVLKARKKEKKECRVSDESIFASFK